MRVPTLHTRIPFLDAATTLLTRLLWESHLELEALELRLHEATQEASQGRQQQSEAIIEEHFSRALRRGILSQCGLHDYFDAMGKSQPASLEALVEAAANGAADSHATFLAAQYKAHMDVWLEFRVASLAFDSPLQAAASVESQLRARIDRLSTTEHELKDEVLGPYRKARIDVANWVVIACPVLAADASPHWRILGAARNQRRGSRVRGDGKDPQ